MKKARPLPGQEWRSVSFNIDKCQIIRLFKTRGSFSVQYYYKDLRYSEASSLSYFLARFYMLP